MKRREGGVGENEEGSDRIGLGKGREEYDMDS